LQRRSAPQTAILYLKEKDMLVQPVWFSFGSPMSQNPALLGLLVLAGLIVVTAIVWVVVRVRWRVDWHKREY
jgi:hypothetical protein